MRIGVTGSAASKRLASVAATRRAALSPLRKGGKRVVPSKRETELGVTRFRPPLRRGNRGVLRVVSGRGSVFCN